MSRAKKLPSGNWRVNQYIGRDANGKRIYKSFTASTKKSAEFMAADFLLHHKKKGKSITVLQAIENYINSKDGILSPTTINGYRVIQKYHLQGIINIPIDKLTISDIQSEINEESKRCSAKTVANVHGLLAAAIKMHDPNFIIHTTLPRKIKKLRIELPTSQQIISAVKDTSIELPVLLALCLCLRMSEVRGIRKASVIHGAHDSVLLIDQVIVPVRGVQVKKELAKTDASRRIIKLPSYLLDRIMECEGDYVTTLSARAIYGRFVNVMKKNGFYGVRFHDLRHIAASDMHRLGITDKVAAERGGWAGTQTMRQVYQHSFSADRESADEIMSKYYEEMLGDK